MSTATRHKKLRKKPYASHHMAGTYPPHTLLRHFRQSSPVTGGSPSNSEVPHHETLYRMGLAYQHLGRHRDAIELLGRAVRGAPEHAEYFHELTVSFLALNQLPEALTMNAAALRLRPRMSSALDLRAQLLHRTGRFDEALATYQELVQSSLPVAEIHNNYGRLAHESGDLETAAQQYEAALKVDPTQIEAYFNLSELARAGKYCLPAHLTAYMTQLAGRDDIEPLRYSRLCFALGVAFETRRDYHQAFAWYRRANDSVQLRHDVMFEGSLHEQHLHFHDMLDAWAIRLQPVLRPILDPLPRTPLFIVGMPRSGTTLLAEILDMHPEITNVGEADLLCPQFEAMYRELSEIRRSLPLEELGQAITNAMKGYLTELNALSSASSKFILDKTPENLLMLGYLCQLLPNARIIWLQREWRDVCWSCYTHCFNSERLANTSSDLDQLRRYHEYCNSVAESWWKVPGPPRIRVQYERLVSEPEPVLRELMEFLDLAWTPELLHFHRKRNVVQTASAAQVRDPLHQRSVGGWRKFAHHLPSWVD